MRSSVVAAARRKGAVPLTVSLASLDVMLASPWPAPFSAPGWLFELKYDGFRLLACKDADAAALRFRSGRPATRAFPEIAQAIAALPFRRIALDGELVVLDDDGRSSFQQLQARSRKRAPRIAEDVPQAVLCVFDLLAADDLDLRGLPLVTRKELLRAAIPADGALRYVDHVMEDGLSVAAEAERLGLEGVVGKRASAPYSAGRSAHWRKVRFLSSDDFVVVGFTPAGLGLEGGLHIAAQEDGRLVYAGRVGSGFASGVLAETRRVLGAMSVDRPPCAGAVPRGRGHTWVEPRVVCEVRYLQRTDDGLLRHPVFLRFRTDKPPRDCGTFLARPGERERP
jgi:bifunctional non-homologous end joining protein LigD